MDLVAWFSDAAGWLAPVARAVTVLGDEEFYILAFPLLYWCVSRRAGVRIGVILLLSGALNGTLKLAFATARPYWLDGGLATGVTAESFGVPSGHAQNGAAVWGLAARESGRRWTWPLAGLLVLALGWSRVQLGVHFATDVLTGWAVGVVLLALFVWLEPRVSPWLARLSTGLGVALSLAAGLALLGAGALALGLHGGFDVPARWLAESGQAGLDPHTLRGVATPAGALTGLGLGLVALRGGGGFTVAAAAWKVALRYPLGVAGVLALLLGLDALLPAGDDLAGITARFVRYATVGAWIGGLAPLLFVRLRLAEPAPAPVPARDAAGDGATARRTAGARQSDRDEPQG